MNAASRKVLSSGIIFYPQFEGKSKEEDRRAHTGTEDWGLHAPSPMVGIRSVRLSRGLMTKRRMNGGWTGTAAIWGGSEGAPYLIGRRVKNPRKLRNRGQVSRPPEAESLGLDYGSNTSQPWELGESTSHSQTSVVPLCEMELTTVSATEGRWESYMSRCRHPQGFT